MDTPDLRAYLAEVRERQQALADTLADSMGSPEDYHEATSDVAGDSYRLLELTERLLGIVEAMANAPVGSVGNRVHYRALLAECAEIVGRR